MPRGAAGTTSFGFACSTLLRQFIGSFTGTTGVLNESEFWRSFIRTVLIMQSARAWQIEYATIGETPQTAASPDRACQVLIGNFDVPSQEPLRGGTPIASFVAELEQDPDMAARLARARQRLASTLDRTATVRNLRLRAGLSQSRLAEIAGTTQPYIVRLEAGSVDPGTDMLARLASALSVPPIELFFAVRTQRTMSF
jgi:DNA-binding XRE family transcriptional regulator